MVSLAALGRALFLRASSFPSLAERRRRRRRLGPSTSRKALDSTLPLSSEGGRSDEENDYRYEDDSSSYSTAYSSFSSSCLGACFNSTSSDKNFMDDSCRMYRKVLSQRKQQDVGLETCFSRGAGTSSIQDTPTPSSACNHKKNTRKRLRFAQVCALVHEVPRNDELNEEEEQQSTSTSATTTSTKIDPLERYWWTEEECMRIRNDAVRRIQYYRRNEPEFRQAVAVLANPHSCRQQIQEEMREISLLHSTTRGFESHICDILCEPRMDVRWAVLDKQDEMMDHKALQELGGQRKTTLIDENQRSGSKESRDNDGDEADADADAWLERIREASMAASLSSRTYALRMGEYDHMEALAAYDYMEPLKAISASPPPHKVLR